MTTRIEVGDFPVPRKVVVDCALYGVDGEGAVRTRRIWRSSRVLDFHQGPRSPDLQGGQRQQEPGQGKLAALGDDHRCLDQLPETGRGTLGHTWHRLRQNHKVSNRAGYQVKVAVVTGLAGVDAFSGVVVVDGRFGCRWWWWGDPAKGDSYGRGGHRSLGGDLT